MMVPGLNTAVLVIFQKFSLLTQQGMDLYTTTTQQHSNNFQRTGRINRGSSYLTTISLHDQKINNLFLLQIIP